jgi:uncharacterized membrane-anchored protein
MFDVLLTILGLITVVSILAIWVAWSNAMFYGVLVAFLVAVGSTMALAYFWRRRPVKSMK